MLREEVRAQVNKLFAEPVGCVFQFVTVSPRAHVWHIGLPDGPTWFGETLCGYNVPTPQVAETIPEDGTLCLNCSRQIERRTRGVMLREGSQ